MGRFPAAVTVPPALTVPPSLTDVVCSVAWVGGWLQTFLNGSKVARPCLQELPEAEKYLVHIHPHIVVALKLNYLDSEANQSKMLRH